MKAGDCNQQELDMTLLPCEGLRMGIGAGGSIKQHIEEDENDPRIWDVANSRILNVQIINSNDYYSITGTPPPHTPIDARTYTELGLPFYEEYREFPASSISGAFQKVQTVGKIMAESSGVAVPLPDAADVGYRAYGSDESATPLDLKVVMLDVDDTLPRFQGTAQDHVYDSSEEE